MKLPFRHLAFAGAGVRNAGYVGAVRALDEAGGLGAIEGVAGTSSGSIIATLLAVGYTTSELHQAMLDLDFGKIPDGGMVRGGINLLTRFGWHPGRYFLKKIEEAIAEKTKDRRTTFRQLERGSYRKLRIVGANLSTHRARIFPDSTSWDLPLAEAVRISMSIPLFFAARRLEGDLYADGGVILNYPIGVFDRPGGDSRTTLGMYMESRREPHRQPIRTLHDFVAASFACLVATQAEDLRLSAVDGARSVRIDDLGVHPAFFGLGNEEKLSLMGQGVQAMRSYLTRFDGPARAASQRIGARAE